IDVRHAFDETARDELVHERVAEPIDIHHTAGGKMPDRLLQACGAVRVDAAAGGLALFANNIAAADRAMLRHAEWPPGLALFDHAHNLRDDVAAALDQHFVADFDAEALDLVFVVQGCS